MAETQRRLLRRTWVRRAVPAGAVAVLVVAGTAVVRTNANATPGDTYRTTTVSTGSVEQRLNLTGSVQRVNQVSQSFAVAGTISSVLVSVGDSVKVGQAVATLDSRPLQSAVTAARADLAQAKATLESDQSAATTATAATPTTVVTPTPTPSSPSATPSGRSGAGANQNLTRAKKRVTTAQSTVAADLGRASAALAKCAPFFPTEAPQTPPPTPAPTTPPPTTAPPTTPPPTTAPPTTSPAAATTAPHSTTTTAPSQAAIKACIGALRTAPTQQKIQRDLQSLTRSQADLLKAFTTVITTTGNTATAPATTTRSGSTRQSTTSQSTSSQSTSQSAGSRTGATGQSSADRVASDQAAVTSAEAALSSAQADLTASTLKSPITGTVGSVSLAKNTSSNGKNIVIVGAGAVEVTINVPLASMANVHVGQKANVTAQGAASSVPGSVTSISLLPFTSSTGTGTGAAQGTGTQGTATSSSPAYPVVVLVPEALPSLASGARAEVSLLIGTAADVLTVPNSALTPLGNGQALAITLKNGVATRALVKTGYAGTLSTQVTSGLTAGQQVVLADLSTALPTNTTNGRRFGVGGVPGGLGGAGIGGAGLGGAGLGGGGFGGGTGTGRTGFTPGG